MMKGRAHLKQREEGWHGNLKSYIFGFGLCVFLTLVAFYLVSEKVLSGSTLIFVLVALGFVQFIIQLVLFLHLGKEPKPHWDLSIFFTMIFIVILLVAGSVWIMYHLNYYNMSDQSIPKEAF
jgi:cytochrome o ubiquinol oxidase operon protein cyoD